MVVQHNLTAMNSNRMLGVTTGSQAKSTEKLSSGYKINRAADDAAGLSISEKMRKQIRGLTQASLNAEDGISAVQTAEGALNEVQDMLQRMNELAVKAANGTMSENDRSYIQDEIDQLVTEIDRVAETTKFNETYLLKGDKSKTAVDYQYKALSEQTLEVGGVGVTGDTPSTLFAKDGTTALTAAAAMEALEAGETLYTGAAVTSLTEAAVTTDYTIANASKASALQGAAGGTTGAKLSIAFAELSEDVTVAEQNALAGFLNGTGVSVTVANAASAATYAFAAGALGTTGLSIDAAGVITDGEGNTVATLTGAAATTDGTETLKIGTVTQAKDKSLTKVADNLYDADGNELTEAEALALIDDNDATTKVYNNKLGQTAAVAGIDYEYTSAETAQLYDKDGNAISANGIQNYYDDGVYSGGLYDEDGNAVDDVTAYVDETQTKIGALTLKLHVGADATDNNQISVDLDAMSAAGIGVDGLKVDGADDTNARNAIETIKAALQQVSTQRSALGAVQNRLEHTIANLDNVVENTTAAESQIRDTDMASEMVKYSNNNILAQAGTSMLAQANQANQNILSLLG